MSKTQGAGVQQPQTKARAPMQPVCESLSAPTLQYKQHQEHHGAKTVPVPPQRKLPVNKKALPPMPGSNNINNSPQRPMIKKLVQSKQCNQHPKYQQLQHQKRQQHPPPRPKGQTGSSPFPPPLPIRKKQEVLPPSSSPQHSPQNGSSSTGSVPPSQPPQQHSRPLPPPRNAKPQPMAQTNTLPSPEPGLGQEPEIGSEIKPGQESDVETKPDQEIEIEPEKEDEIKQEQEQEQEQKLEIEPEIEIETQPKSEPNTQNLPQDKIPENSEPQQAPSQKTRRRIERPVPEVPDSNIYNIVNTESLQQLLDRVSKSTDVIINNLLFILIL